MPFLSGAAQEHKHLFEQDPADVTALARFEQEWKIIVDFGLFFIGLANAGVEFSIIGTATWLVPGSLLAGKSIGIAVFGKLAERTGFAPPRGIGGQGTGRDPHHRRIRLTVALFMTGEVFTDPARQGARMGATLSVLSAPRALVMAKALKIREVGAACIIFS